MIQKDIEQATQKTVDYLYKIEGECPPELYEAISMLRQLINEEFKPAKSLSSQFIYDILYPRLSNFVSKDEILKARPAKEIPSGAKEYFDETSPFDAYGSGYNQALKDWSKAMGIEG